MYGNRITIEFADRSDVKQISELSRKYIEYDLGSWKYNPEKLTNLLKSDIKNVVVARNGGRLAGFGIMTYYEKQANLDLLAVKPDYQRCGIGRQIVNWLEEVALTAGVYVIFVQVRKTNTGAVQFYKKLGFTVIDEMKRYYGGRESGVIMSKNVRGLIPVAYQFADEKDA
jgi:ribosomal-protein-alanine N-acetyltransferase